ncbi:hypothetical protein [Mycolicibacterium celeriflavum]|uniref:Uncharacterized protein n=1 Tax=Mycolicibacterium celeriflavum TaxID=1249101 RepID=A0A1X0C2C2_MYCCF|nr:hypothetical protein [Mycolicibacterium celeriflavum]MCV7238279.1 hypothetical protein [Mycolicibacterium celeriflavum]ORA51033.1 hypothetical protein BST21_02500 [Mycolicibacterium celeriflavum]BBY44915.1 hypothetical protein MCEL_32100 [Mycolicibacterium celeriflavum]
MNNNDEVVLAVYEQGALLGSQLQEAVDNATNELAGDPGALAELGLTAGDLGEGFNVKERSGFDPGSVLIAIVIGAGGKLAADATKATAKAVWNMIARKIREERGSDALGNERPTPDKQ